MWSKCILSSVIFFFLIKKMIISTLMAKDQLFIEKPATQSVLKHPVFQCKFSQQSFDHVFREARLRSMVWNDKVHNLISSVFCFIKTEVCVKAIGNHWNFRWATFSLHFSFQTAVLFKEWQKERLTEKFDRRRRKKFCLYSIHFCL